MLEQMIKELSEEMALASPPALSDERRYTLTFDPDIDVSFSEVDRTIVCRCLLGAVPQEGAEPFLLRVMEANLFGMGTRGGVIGLDKEGKQLTFSCQINSGLRYDRFKVLLTDFVSAAAFWREATLKAGQ